LSALLGKAVKESGELITDKIRYRRFKNQVVILQRAEELLNKSGLKAKDVSLKTLVPLIERGSLEEDSKVQEMWANLLANATQSHAKSGLHAICIEVLSSISPLEAQILYVVLSKYEKERPEALAKIREWNAERKDIYPASIFFRPHELYKQVKVSDEDGEFLLDNLLRLNILRWENPDVDDSLANPASSPVYVHLTSLGLNVLRECTKVSAGGNDDA
jgi:Abortive infection alpha